MAIRSGIDAQLGIVDEVTYGTPVTVTRFLEFVSEGMSDGVVGSVDSLGLGRSRHLRHDRTRKYSMPVSGPVVYEVMDTGFALLLKHLLGSLSSGNVSAVYTHTITPDDTNGLFGTFFTMQIGKPGTAGTVHPFTYTGCKIPSWSMACGLNEILRLTTNVHARSVGTATALASKSYGTGQPFIFVDGSLTIGGSAVDIASFTLNGNNGLDVERKFLGSGLNKEPIQNARTDISGELDAEFEDLTEFAAWVAGTQAQLVLTFQSSREISAGNPYKLTVTIPAIEYAGSLPTVGGPEIVRQALPFRALKNASNPIITMAYITSDTTP